MSPTSGLRAALEIVLAIAVLAPAAAQITPQRAYVDTALGRVQGTYCTGASNTFKWLGIPYAQAPIGDLRWAAPVAYSTRYPSPQLDATRVGPLCPQDLTRGLGGYPGASTSENCLTINVWAPLAASAANPAPVRVYLHGGMLDYGAGSWGAYDGCQSATTANVVVVSFNYRLGMLGWLGLPGLGSGSGNFGLMDTQLALQWVQNNIRAFGGDPSRVTLHGQDAGGMLALANLVSPRAYNANNYTTRLFQALIMQSPILDQYNSLNDTYAQTAEFSALANCTFGDLACLRALSPDQIIAAQKRMQLQNDLGPTIDGTILTDSPWALMDLGRMPRMPLLLTFSADEGNLIAGTILNSGSAETTQAQAEAAIISQLNPPLAYRTKIFNTYNSANFHGCWYCAVAAAIGDRVHAGSIRLLNGISALGSNAYAGLYVMPTTNGCPYRMLGLNATQIAAFGSRLGAAHGADIASFQEHPMLPNGAPAFPWNCTGANYTTQEKQLAAFVGGAVASFMTTQNPIPITSNTATSPALQALTSWTRYRGLFGTVSGDTFLRLDVDTPGPVNYTSEQIARTDLLSAMRDYMDLHGRYGDYSSVQAYVQSRSDLSMIRTIITTAGYGSSLLAGSATYFFPTDTAVNDYLTAANMTFQKLLAQPVSQLQYLVNYHVYPSAFDVVKGMPPRQRVVMANGHPAYFQRTDTNVRVLDTALFGSLVDPTSGSITAGRSYINIVNRVLNPAPVTP